ncbi:MAG: hypothetical protein BWZ02_01504 [Lentisphaerae bacterium ADurb.BinA184]|nr:MAG: hypothetical protein BWZ02_01504 [Lentisphaerae bacterium ADurb.BinA184]
MPSGSCPVDSVTGFDLADTEVRPPGKQGVPHWVSGYRQASSTRPGTRKTSRAATSDGPRAQSFSKAAR